jgi:predicted CoA-substrate-specific enzyme activase
MIVAGIDVGSLTAKAVILGDDHIYSYALRPTGIDISGVAQAVTEDAVKKIGLSFKDIERFISTGYGRISIPFASETVTEITCNATGVHSVYPSVRVVLDVGGQDSKAVRMDAEGRVVKFAMNDKCAAGTGRFLEVAAQTLGVRVEDLGELSLKAKEKIRISSTCTVFAQTEIVSLIAKQVSREDIIAGLHDAIASRVFGLVNSVNPEGGILMTGGVARNIGVVKALEHIVGARVMVPDNPQILTALGAALIAKSK